MTTKKIRRDQLAKFIKDQEVIIRFQQLFEEVDENSPTVSIDGSTIDAKASVANDLATEAIYNIVELEFLMQVL
jgi:hypothetical protein